MRKLNLVGNDIVDFSLPETGGKERDPRFLERILNGPERRKLEESPNPKTLLWCLWSAKETAYKIGKKFDSSLVFSPRRFRVEAIGLSKRIEEGSFSGLVRHNRFQVFVRWDLGPDWVHCVGSLRKPTLLGQELRSKVKTHLRGSSDPQSGELVPLSGEERKSAYSRASAFVRILAKEILDDFGFSGVEILRPFFQERPGPPRIFRNGKPLRHFDLSLSHHGRFAAAAVLKSLKGGLCAGSSFRTGIIALCPKRISPPGLLAGGGP